MQERKHDSKKGYFLTFEGGEGSGKTTQIELTYDWIEGRGHSCVMTREPGATIIGAKIRGILLDAAHTEMLPLTELLLYGADRGQHVGEIIRPSLKDGKIVLCDRYADSTRVYQGYARGFDKKLVNQTIALATEGLSPDLTILLDVPVEVGLHRAWARIGEDPTEQAQSRFEQEAIDFHEKLRKGYLELAKQESERIVIIDAQPKEEIVFEEVKKCLEERLRI